MKQIQEVPLQAAVSSCIFPRGQIHGIAASGGHQEPVSGQFPEWICVQCQ